MAFSLIDDDAGAVPITVMAKDRFEPWREQALAGERDWAAATGFSAEAGKLALLPDKEGRLGRVLVGMPEEGSAMWALAGLSETFPAGAYRLDTVPEGGDPSRLALGWALGTYAFDLYRKAEKKKDRAMLVW